MDQLTTSEIVHRKGIALNGYDVVAFFEKRQAIRGSRTYSIKWKGLEWWFINNQYRDLFTENPEKYLPQFGGYCAFGVANGYKAPVKPAAFTIVENKLYFNFAKYIQKRWLENMDQKIAEAEKRWSKVKSTQPITANRILIWWKYRFLQLFGKDIFR